MRLRKLGETKLNPSLFRASSCTATGEATAKPVSREKARASIARFEAVSEQEDWGDDLDFKDNQGPYIPYRSPPCYPIGPAIFPAIALSARSRKPD